jgi:phosphatidylinositol-3-phosphatase
MPSVRAQHLGHVFIIMLENHAADHVIGDPKTPFITSLAHEYGTATNYYGITHTSEPNYIGATSGSTWWTNDDDGWYSGKSRSQPRDRGQPLPP